jgi:hypothetical protein
LERNPFFMAGTLVKLAWPQWHHRDARHPVDTSASTSIREDYFSLSCLGEEAAMTARQIANS